jgi:hypothetical protein
VRAATNAVVKDFDSPWWWGGWPFFHSRGGTGMVEYILLQYLYYGVDFRGDPDMVLPPGEVFDHQGMM